MEKAILLNFAYGYGSCLRALGIALELNNILKEKGEEEFKIICPLIYGEKQKKIILDNHLDIKNVVYDEKLGIILSKILYDGTNYKENLKYIEQSYKKTEKEFRRRLDVLKDNYDIKLEISRNPRINSRIPSSYCTTMCLLSETLKKSVEKGILNEEDIIENYKIAKEIEGSQRKIYISEPNILPISGSQILIPPLVKRKEKDTSNIEKGLFLYYSGIKNIKNHKIIDKKFKVHNSLELSPKVITNKNILGVICRAGLGVTSETILEEKPLMVLPHEKNDDPEIYFNIKKLNELDIAVSYNIELDIEENLKNAISKIENIKEYKKKLVSTYGTLDGSKYCAELIYKDLNNL